MQVFCKKTLHIINADCRKGNACITVFLELRKEFQRGRKPSAESARKSATAPGKSAAWRVPFRKHDPYARSCNRLGGNSIRIADSVCELRRLRAYSGISSYSCTSSPKSETLPARVIFTLRSVPASKSGSGRKWITRFVPVRPLQRSGLSGLVTSTSTSFT